MAFKMRYSYPMPSPRKMTVVYDNSCRSCTVARSFGEKLDTSGTIEYVGMHTDKGRELVAKHGLDMEKSAYAIAEDGSIASHAKMIHAVLNSSGFFGQILSRLLHIFPESLANRLYDFASRHRIR